MPVKTVTPYLSNGDQTVNLRFWYAGQNFAFPFANTDAGHWVLSRTVPDLDVTHDLSLRIDRTAQKMMLSSSIGGDGFPNCESFIVDANGAVCFVGTHIRIGTAATQLPGGRLLPMTRTTAVIDWTASNTFGANIEVQTSFDYTGNGGAQTVVRSGSMSISDWNSAHTGRDASGPWLRQVEDNVPTGRQTWREMNEWFDNAVREVTPYLDPMRLR